jgi:hypothetical protein
MTPEAAAAAVRGWAHRYTRGLPRDAAERRLAELDADLHDHIAHERARGTGERRIALGILARMLRGSAADAAWRRSRRTSPAAPVRRAALRITLVTATILLVPLVGMAAGGDVHWSVADFIAAILCLAGGGTILELARHRVTARAAIGLALPLGAVAILAGDADDAPGLVLFGLVLVAATLALGVRRAWRGTGAR